MVKHIVMWKLKNRADAVAISERLEALSGRIPGLLHIEAGIDFLGSEQSADVALYAEFESRKALDAYQTHPEHRAIAPFVKAAAISRVVADYEA